MAGVPTRPSSADWPGGLNLIDASVSLSFSLHLNPLVTLFLVQMKLGQARYKVDAFEVLGMYLNSQRRKT